VEWHQPGKDEIDEKVYPCHVRMKEPAMWLHTNNNACCFLLIIILVGGGGSFLHVEKSNNVPDCCGLCCQPRTRKNFKLCFPIQVD
jgi:hypothetical protein